MRRAFPGAGIPGHGPGNSVLGACFRGSWVNTCGFCTGRGKVVGQWQIGGHSR